MLLKHPNGQWYKSINGKRYYFGAIRHDPDGAEAMKEYLGRLPGIHAGTDHLRARDNAAGQKTVGDLLARYMVHLRAAYAAQALSGKTFADYTRELQLFVDWAQAGTPVESLQPTHFAAFVQNLIEGRKLRAHARKRSVTAIKTMFRWGASNGLFALPNFGTAMKAPPTTKAALRRERARLGLADHSDRIVTGAEVDRMLAIAPPNMKAMILLGLNCGLGPADLGRMRWRHIDLTTGKLDYPRPKTGNARTGYLWKKTRAALERVKELKHTAAAFAKDGEDALVFVTRRNQPYYRERAVMENGKMVGVTVNNAISLTFGRLAVKANLAGLGFYRLRHTFKTLGKKARDRDALNLCMGHHTNSVEAGYDHEEISFRRIKRVAIKVLKRAWPVNTSTASPAPTPTMQTADAA